MSVYKKTDQELMDINKEEREEWVKGTTGRMYQKDSPFWGKPFEVRMEIMRRQASRRFNSSEYTHGEVQFINTTDSVGTGHTSDY